MPENLVSRDGFSRPVPRQPAHLYTQAESGAYLRDSSRVPVEVLGQRRGDDLSSGRGSVKWVITALTTDSDLDSDTPQGNIRDFRHLRKGLASGVDGPVAFRTRLIDVIDYSDRAPRRPALETLQKFGVPSFRDVLLVLLIFI